MSERLKRFFGAVTTARMIMAEPRMDANNQREEAIRYIMDALDRETYSDLRAACCRQPASRADKEDGP
jgi:hypothetical protein